MEQEPILSVVKSACVSRNKTSLSVLSRPCGRVTSGRSGRSCRSKARRGNSLEQGAVDAFAKMDQSWQI
jgi:hypothetical protein